VRSPELDFASYPGLNTEASALWRQFLTYYGDQFYSYSYNVRVGRGLDPGPSATPEMRAQWRAVTTKRVDVVAEKLGQTWVIEVEPRPGLRTFGQVVGYVSLLPKYYPTQPSVMGALVCEYIGFDMAGLFIQAGIPYFVFPPHGQIKFPALFPPSPQT